MKDSVRQRVAVSRMAPLLVLLLGCGGSDAGPPRVAVDGEVTFEGRPLEKGSILFIPAGESRGPRTGAVVEAGQYRLPRERGPIVGQLRVEIRAESKLDYDTTEPTESVRHIGEPRPPGVIPPEYNERSILAVETTAEGPNSFDFHLPTQR